MKNKLIVKLSQKHINKGRRGQEEYCPLAHAIRETTNSSSVRVDFDRAYIGGYVYKLTDRAVRFVRAFDLRGRKAVKPHTFILRKRN